MEKCTTVMVVIDKMIHIACALILVAPFELFCNVLRFMASCNIDPLDEPMSSTGCKPAFAEGGRKLVASCHREVGAGQTVSQVCCCAILTIVKIIIKGALGSSLLEGV